MLVPIYPSFPLKNISYLPQCCVSFGCCIKIQIFKMNLLIANTKGTWVVFGPPVTHWPENRSKKTLYCSDFMKIPCLLMLRACHMMKAESNQTSTENIKATSLLSQ